MDEQGQQDVDSPALWFLFSLFTGAIFWWLFLSLATGRDPGGMVEAWQSRGRFFGYPGLSKRPKVVRAYKVMLIAVPAFMSASSFWASLYWLFH